jgi:hypothetical protein
MPYGTVEVRYLSEGSYLIAGVLMDKLPGDNLKDKMEKFMTEAGSKGFLVKACIVPHFMHTLIDKCSLPWP